MRDCSTPSGSVNLGPYEIGVREEPNHPSIAVEEGMDPSQPMVRCRGGHDPLQLSKTGWLVGLREAREEPFERTMMRRYMAPNLNLPRPQLPRNHRALLAVRPTNPTQLERKSLVELAVDPAQESGRTDSQRRVISEPLFHQALHFNVREALLLELLLLLGITARVGTQRTLDLDGMCAVSLDEVRVVAVHRSEQLGHRRARGLAELHTERGGLPQDVDRQISQLILRIRWKQRLHRGWMVSGHHESSAPNISPIWLPFR